QTQRPRPPPLPRRTLRLLRPTTRTPQTHRRPLPIPRLQRHPRTRSPPPHPRRTRRQDRTRQPHPALPPPPQTPPRPPHPHQRHRPTPRLHRRNRTRDHHQPTTRTTPLTAERILDARIPSGSMSDEEIEQSLDAVVKRLRMLTNELESLA